jgi:hypothetical protein
LPGITLTLERSRLAKQRQKKLTIKNKGNADLVISGISVDNTSLFATDWAGQVVVTPKKSYKVKASFTSTSAGIQTGVLTIVSNDSHSPTFVTLDAKENNRGSAEC